MSNQQGHDYDRLEADLRRLKPTAPAFERDRLLYLSGRASAKRAGGRLALLAASIGIVVGVAGTFVGMKMTASPPTIQVVVVPGPAPAPVAPAPVEPPIKQEAPAPATAERATFAGWDALFPAITPASGYLHLRNQALRWGVEALPTAVPSSAGDPRSEPASLRKLQSQWIGRASDI